MSNVLVIPDLHNPWSRLGGRQFCEDTADKWKCDKIVFIGDVVDAHFASFHTREPSAPGALEEYERTKAAIAQWYRSFPDAIVTIGNHDRRAVRQAKTVNLPEIFLKPYSEIWNTPNWKWMDSVTIDNVYYYHGDGQGGEYPASNAVRKMLMSIVIGHNHTASGVKYYVNPMQRIFACDTGCLIDDKAIAFAYSDQNKRRSVLSVAVIVDEVPYVIPMPCGKNEHYHDSRFKRKAKK